MRVPIYIYTAQSNTWKMKVLVCLLLLWHFSHACIYTTPTSAPLQQGLLPKCGNGVLDEGERCDDGNRVDGDGCSSWCTSFDRYARACTLAGANIECPTAVRNSYTSSPSNARFCSLTSVDASPRGDYVILADGGRLYRMDLEVLYPLFFHVQRASLSMSASLCVDALCHDL